MVVDYSKWDKLELSDDSDIEVHPNVDKRSFIRWKQRDIHEKRSKLKHDIDQLDLSLEVNKDVVQRMAKLVEVGSIQGKDATRYISKDIAQAVAISGEGQTKARPRPRDNVDLGDQPEYSDMIESLLEQVAKDVGDLEGDARERAYVERIKEHQAKVQGIIADQQKQYEQLVEERSRHITSEDVRTGFEKTIVNKSEPKPEPKAPAKGKAKQTVQSVEVLNQAGVTAASAEETSGAAESVEDDEADPDALTFSQLTVGNFSQSYSFLASHTHIISEQQKDALIMHAFQAELAGDSDRMRQIVHQALLLQYAAQFGAAGLQAFFSKVALADHPAHEAFMKDVNFTINHIKTRCKVIQAENSNATEAVEQIQLHSVDPDTEIMVRVPDQADAELWEAYSNLPLDMQLAVQTRKLDEINKVLAKLSVEDAEQMVAQLDRSGALSLEPRIYDESEWKDIKERAQVGAGGEVEGEDEDEDEQEEEKEGQEPVSSVDDVD